MSTGYVVLLWLLLGVFIILPSFFLGTIRIFLWADNKFCSLPSFIRFLIAWFLPVLSFITGVSIIIGIVEIYQQWKRYRKRKSQGLENKDNESIWKEMCLNDRRKLIYAYLIFPFHEVFLDHMTLSKVYKQIYPMLSDYVLLIASSFTIIFGDIMLMLTPTLIRFLVIRRKLKYGTEISGYLIMSLFLSLYMNFHFTGNMVSSLGIMYTFAAYCILSYQSSEYSDEWYLLKINPILLTVVGLLSISLFSWVIINKGQYIPQRGVLLIDDEGQYIPIREAVVIICMWLMNKENAISKRSESIPEAPQQPTPEPSRPPINQSSELIAVGLASIGRTTSLPNEYLTEAKTAERRNIERPFLRQLADKYRDEAHRKVLARHFMVYKETTLFIVYALVLKGDKELHDRVRQGLKEHLLLGVSTEAQKKRNDCWHRISRKFNDEYKKHGEYGTALKFSFWSTLAEEKLDWFTLESVSEFLGNNMLHDVFMYSYKAVERKYKDLAKQSW